MSHQDPFQVVQSLETTGGKKGSYYSLPALEKNGVGEVSRLPVCLRVILESLLRNLDGKAIKEEDVKTLAQWNPGEPSKSEIPFVVSRIVLQDFTGVPLLVDLAAMRDAIAAQGQDAKKIEPLVPVDLVVDHSVQVDRSRTAQSFTQNLEHEFQRNLERYEFLKWGQQAFDTFDVVPPAIGIVHQVNLEYLAKVVFEKETDEGTFFYPDTLVGTDSHTTMINGLGVVGWGVGGIEAEAGMLGQPIAFQTPEVIGVHLTGKLREGVTATDLTLKITQMLRVEKVVGKFVEFFGEGAANLTLADRATIGNMAPEYGATMGFFPVDEQTLEYLYATGRSSEHINLVREYYQNQGMFGMPEKGDIDYTKVLELDLDTIVPCCSGPKRPQDRIDLPELKQTFRDLLTRSAQDGGYGLEEKNLSTRVALEDEDAGGLLVSGGKQSLDKDLAESNESEMVANKPASPSNNEEHVETANQITHGSVLIAAITSCTNTSNPSVMIAAGLLARNAVKAGLEVPAFIKTSLAPGSRVVTDYLQETGLLQYLNQLGFNLVGYGCTTCIGNSGPLDETIEQAVQKNNLVTASVLSGNRNFEARIHGAIKANFLMSPPLVVAYALAGTVNFNIDEDPLGYREDGNPLYLKDLWPSHAEIQQNILKGLKPEMFTSKYAEIEEANPQWNEIKIAKGDRYAWKEDSTYIQKPPFFDGFGPEPPPIEPVHQMRPLCLFGNSVTTDHISPAGAIPEDSPAGRYLNENGIVKKDFNSFGSRRGNDRVMTRGTFANVRIKNLLADGKEGGYTKLMPEGKVMDIYDAAEVYAERSTPLIVFAGADYGMGSSRDWAAKGTRLLGVRAVVAVSYERIHRSNLIGMGVLPLQFIQGENHESHGITGEETYSLPELGESIAPGQYMPLIIHRENESDQKIQVACRMDTPIEVEYYQNGGILPYVLRRIMQRTSA